MKKFIGMLFRHWAKEPVKIALTLLAVALGTGILILSFSASSILKQEVTEKLADTGLILYVANGNWAADGTIEQIRPPQFDQKAPGLVVSDIQQVTHTAIVSTSSFAEVSINGNSYQIRNILGSEPAYFDVFDLNMVEGRPMSEEDVKSGFKKVWISEETARMLFGSAADAVGQFIQPPSIQRASSAGSEPVVIPKHTVTGVYENPDEVSRRSYGIGDMIFPYTSIAPVDKSVSFVQKVKSGLFIVKAQDSSKEKIESSIRQVLSSTYGPDTDITVWEGSLTGTSGYMEELRHTVDIFTISINILGALLLVISSVGIFSIMVVESLGRQREIALERAIGSSKGRVVWEFWTWSLALSFIGALLGVAFAALIAEPVLATLSPLIGEVSGGFSEAAGIKALPVGLGFLMAIGFGSFLGLLPAFGAVQGNIAETLQDV